jgi:hypothetical protein
MEAYLVRDIFKPARLGGLYGNVRDRLSAAREGAGD